MNTNKPLTGDEGVKFDDRTQGLGSFKEKQQLSISINSYIERRASAVKDFMQTHVKVLKYAAAMSALCLMTNEAYAVDIVATFNNNIITPIYTLVSTHYGKGVGVIAMGYLILSEGADMRTKATRAGIGALFAYGLGNILFPTT